MRLVFVPIVNPWGMWSGRRSNPNGVDLMRKAFHADKGPLTNLSDPEREREALSHLFAGAMII